MDPTQFAELLKTLHDEQPAGVFNWQINVADILVIVGAALLLYGRVVAIETKIKPIWEWWISTRQIAADDPLLINRRRGKV